MTLALNTLKYNYKQNLSLKSWAETAYKVKGYSSATENISTLFAQLESKAGFNPYDSLDSYVPGLENSPLGDNINSGMRGSYFYNQSDYDYYTYTAYHAFPAFEYDTVSMTGEKLLDDSGGGSSNLSQKVDADITRLGINGMSQEKLTKYYKNLTTEMQELKKYTLSNEDINSIIEEINTLNGAGVKGNLETQINKAQDDLFNVLGGQMKNFARNDYATIKAAMYDVTGINALTTDMYDTDNINDNKIATMIKAEVYEDSPFYKYYVGLRTNPKYTFENAFSNAFEEFISDTSPIVDQDWVEDYEGIAAEEDKVKAFDFFKDLYGVEELLQFYKQYEEAENKTNSMELSLTTAVRNSAEFDYRKVMASKILALLDTEHKLAVSNDVKTVNGLHRGNGDITSHAPFDGFYGDINTKAVPVTTDSNNMVDPYEIVINGTKYIMGKDANSNGTIDNVSEILGITDSIENPFESLLLLDSDKDGEVSKDELLRNGIVLKAVNDSGKLTNTSFDLSLINGIDLKTLNAVKNGTSIGTFEMTFLNGRTAQGSQTFENQSYFNNLFGKLVDLRPYQAAVATTTTATTAATTAETDEQPKETETTPTASTVNNIARTTLLSQINNMYNSLIVDDTSNVETILDNSCWKTSTILTPAQRIRIIDSIDPMMPLYKIESEINNALKTLNT